MSRLFSFLLILLPTSLFAQFFVGSEGITVRNNTVLTIDSLVLQPSADLSIENNRLDHRYTPVPGSPTASVNRVYEWDVPIVINGNVKMYVANTELNGNNLPSLQLAYSPVAGNREFVTSGFSTVDISENSVSGNFNTITIKQLTAVNAISVLPVKWLSFTARKMGDVAKLDWRVSEAENVRDYEVQRSADGQLFETIATLPSACNNCGQLEMDYTYTDSHPFSGNNFYRIKETDYGGLVSYSEIRVVVFDNTLSGISIGPNPANKYVQLFSLDASRKYSITLYSINGVELKKEVVTNRNTCVIKTENLPAGAYVISIETETGRAQKIVRIMR